MNETFTYEWHELTRGQKPGTRLILQASLLGIFVGLIPGALWMLTGQDLSAVCYQLMFMVVAIPVILIVACQKKEPLDITTSRLLIADDELKVNRYVISETGRRYFTVWDLLEIPKAIRLDEVHRVIQLYGKWRVSAYHVKDGEPDDFVDSDIRMLPQTFQLTPEAFYEAVKHLRMRYPGTLSEMSESEYKKAEPFIHKHYGI